MTSSKRGLGWPWDNPEGEFDAYMPAIHDKELTWLFNWEMWMPNGFPAGLNYVPQVRTGSEAAQIDQCLSTIVTKNVDHFIGFNEPDNSGQANVSIAQAVQLWNQYVLPAKNKYDFKLGSPAVTNSPAGKKWLRDFLHSLGGHDEVDFIVLHWYGLNVKDLEGYLVDMHNTFDKPIWLNEFACTTFGGQEPSEQDVEKFEQEALKLLDGKDFVEKYAWFGAAANNGSMGGVAAVNGLAKDGHLTAVGEIYGGKPETQSAAVINAAPEPQEAVVEAIVEAIASENNAQLHIGSLTVEERDQPGIEVTNRGKKGETENLFNNYWNGSGTAGPNFDHPEKPTHLKPGTSAFVALPATFKGVGQKKAYIEGE